MLPFFLRTLALIFAVVVVYVSWSFNNPIFSLICGVVVLFALLWLIELVLQNSYYYGLMEAELNHYSQAVRLYRKGRKVAQKEEGKPIQILLNQKLASLYGQVAESYRQQKQTKQTLKYYRLASFSYEAAINLGDNLPETRSNLSIIYYNWAIQLYENHNNVTDKAKNKAKAIAIANKALQYIVVTSTAQPVTPTAQLSSNDINLLLTQIDALQV